MNFRVGSWQVRPDRNVLTCDAHSIHVSPKAMEVLAYLARRHGQVVGKEELIHALWNDVFVTDDALTRCIGELRRAVEDDAREPSFIQNIPKRGYLLLPEVVWDELHDGTAPGSAPPEGTRQIGNGVQGGNPRRRFWFVAGLVVTLLAIGLTTYLVTTWSRPGVPPPTKHRVAVIPLTNVSADPQQEYFADGMTEQLITELAQIGAWEVLSRTSVMRYKQGKKSLPEIGHELNADWLVEGTVQRAGGRVRITAQLINARTDTHIWSESFDRDMSDILAIQKEIARKIADEMDLTLARQEQARLMAVKKVDPNAYDSYLKGLYFLNRDDYAMAADYFEAATLKDPDFAIAYALLWEADSMTTFVQDVPWSERAIRAAHKALEIDPSLAEAHTAMGDIKFYGDWDWTAGEAEFRRAVELNPNSTDAAGHYATCLHLLGRSDLALSEIRRALQLDPASLRLNQLYLVMLTDMHKNDEALQQARKTLELDPNSSASYVLVASMYEENKQDEEALRAYLKADSLGRVGAEELKQLQSAASSAGLRRYTQQQLIEFERKAHSSRVPPITLAKLYAKLGDRDNSIRFLDLALQQHSGQLAWIGVARSWDPIRSDPRFRSVINRMHFPK